jgi:uncharacterized protein involved in exopolysaccharide biosynthesis
LGRRAWQAIPQIGSPKVEVVAWLRVRRDAAPITDGDNGPDASDPALAEFREAQAELLRGPLVITAALRMPGIAQLPIVRQQEDPVKWLASRLTVTTRPETKMIGLQLKGNDPEQLAQLVDALVSAYQDHLAGISRMRHRDELTRLQSEQELKHQEIETRERALVQVRQQLEKVRPGNGPLSTELELRDFDRLERRLDRLEDLLLELDSQLKVQAEMGDATSLTRDALPTPTVRQLQIRKETVMDAWEQTRKAYEDKRTRLLAAERLAAEMEGLAAEIQRLRGRAAQTARKLEQLDSGRQTPARVVVVQRAALAQ